MRRRLTLAIVASIAMVQSAAADGWNTGGSAAAVTVDPARGVYVGVFGGGGYGSSTDISQLGTAFLTEAEGGPLAVNGRGSIGGGGVGFVGGQVGYEFSRNALMLPAFEIEGMYLSSGTRSGIAANPNDRLGQHNFDDSFKVNNTVFLANMVVSFPGVGWGVTPYIGGGIGAARVAANGANSLQVDPPEPGVNHFNSDTDSSDWTFAGQIKVGARLALTSNAYLFGEYRYLYIGSTEQTYGSTVYPDHAPTSPWTVNMDSTSYSLATAGIGLNF